MKTDDPNSYTYGESSNDGFKGDLWNYGIEIWCNLEGQYVTMLVDLTHLSN